MKTVIRSTAALTIAQGVGYVISLAEVPILARALGPTAYGELIWVQATALLTSILVDYGFNLSASREIARNRDSDSFVQRICGEVFLAKLMLLTLVTLPLLIAYLIFTPVAVAMALAGFVYFLGFGLTPFWYFQGMERMGRAVAIETVTRLAALIGLLLLVTSPEDKTLGLTIMAVGSIACTGITIAMCRSEVGSFKGSVNGAIEQLRQSTAFFVYKSSGQLMITAATTVLGSISGQTAVGIFAPAEKVVKAVIGLALPGFHAFYPHLSRLFVQDRHKKHQQSIWLVSGVTISGLTAAIVLSFVGPTIMAWMLGPGYDGVNQLLLLMVWLIPLRLLNQTLGFAVLLPAQKERTAGITMLLSSALSLGLGAFLAISHGAMGMVTGMLIGEAVLVVAQLYLAARVLKN
jgi:PST family polysaccharide transporter